jgi:hypothetical protein
MRHLEAAAKNITKNISEGFAISREMHIHNIRD